jgi:DNA-binding NarL/FixJ family response regulator
VGVESFLPYRQGRNPLPGTAVKPFRPLTAAQEKVARAITTGLSYKIIGVHLNMSHRTVQHHIGEIAKLLPDDGLSARNRVMIWAHLYFSHPK